VSEDGFHALLTSQVSETTVLSLCILDQFTFVISSIDGKRGLWSVKCDVLEQVGTYAMQTRSKGASCGIRIADFYLIGDQDGYLQLLTHDFVSKHFIFIS
jgi:hypothetical protein